MIEKLIARSIPGLLSLQIKLSAHSKNAGIYGRVQPYFDKLRVSAEATNVLKAAVY